MGREQFVCALGVARLDGGENLLVLPVRLPAVGMEQLRRDYRKVPGLKALRGMKGWFRVRVGDYRIIFTVDPTSGKAEIRRVTRRNEETYKRLG